MGGVDWRSLDIRGRDDVAALLEEIRPAVIINVACRPGDWAATADGGMHVAAAAAATGARLVHVSSDAVFSGLTGGDSGYTVTPDEPFVAAVARRLGVAPATLRTWDRRYGLGPTLHNAGAHRRYSRSDIARLEAMRRLVLDGVPPADAARLAVETVPNPRDGWDSPPPGPSGLFRKKKYKQITVNSRNK